MSEQARRRRPIVLAFVEGRGLPASGPQHARCLLGASGPAERLRSAGTPDRETRRIVLSSGRPMRDARATIDRSLRDGAFSTNAVIRELVGRAKDSGGRLHLVGLVSDGGVHSSLEHAHGLIDVARQARVRVVVHAILDGRDVGVRTAASYVSALEARLAGGVGRIGTVGGRLWGMAGVDRWDRVERVYRAIMAAEVRRVDSSIRGIEEAYESGAAADDAIEPFVVFDYPGVSPVDVAMHFNFGADGARALSRALASPTFDRFARKGGRPPFAGRYAGLATYEPSLGLPAAFPEEPLQNAFPEVLARAGLAQFRCAGTERIADVTTLFNCGRQAPFDGEERETVASSEPALAVSEAVQVALRSQKYAFVLAHLGTGPAASLEASAARLHEAARSADAVLLFVRDRNPAELVCYYDREPTVRLRDEGRYCDLAPTLLDLMGVPRPDEMTGRSLLLG